MSDFSVHAVHQANLFRKTNRNNYSVPFESSHNAQFFYKDHLYIFMDINDWYHANPIPRCLFKVTTTTNDENETSSNSSITTNNTNNKQPKLFNVESIETKGDIPLGGRIFFGFYFDQENGLLYMHGGLLRYRVLSNTLYCLDVNNLEWKELVCCKEKQTDLPLKINNDVIESQEFQLPYLEGHAIIQRKPNEFYFYGGHVGNLVFSNQFTKLTILPNNQVIVTKMENMLHYNTVTKPVAYHQATYFPKKDIMLVFGGKLKPGVINVPMSNELLLYNFQSRTWIQIDNSISYFSIPKVRSHILLNLGDYYSKFLIYGGTKSTKDEPNDFYHEFFIYDLEENSWTKEECLCEYQSNVKYIVHKKNDDDDYEERDDDDEDWENVEEEEQQEDEEIGMDELLNLINYQIQQGGFIPLQQLQQQQDNDEDEEMEEEEEIQIEEEEEQEMNDNMEDEEEDNDNNNIPTTGNLNLETPEEIEGNNNTEIDVTSQDYIKKEFGELFPGRNYFSMSWDAKRQRVFIFGGSTTSKNGTILYESNSLVMVECKLQPSKKKLFPNLKNMLDNQTNYVDIDCKTLE
ncbi:hypothetical protein ABK040_000723 [Willaertia magna]